MLHALTKSFRLNSVPRRLFVCSRCLAISEQLGPSVALIVNKTLVSTLHNQNVNPQVSSRVERTEHLKSFKKSRKEPNLTFSLKDCDTFGTLDSSKNYQRLVAEDLPDDDDGFDYIEINKGKKISYPAYCRIFRELLCGKPIKLAEALQLFEKMKSEDRVPPSVRNYTLLMEACGKQGYTKKAFELFEEVVRKDMRVTKAMITCLFNACAECPFPEFGLQKANYLRDLIQERGYHCNMIHHHAMIKAFGKLGDMQTAFQVVKEMVENEQTVTNETYAMLLIGCISDKKSGLFNAIKIYRQMKLNGVQPTIYTYNLLLRAVRDCKFGTPDSVDSMIQSWNKTKRLSDNQNFCQGRPTELQVSSSEGQNSLVQMPNLLSTSNINSQIINLDMNLLDKASNRLMLIGGINGVLKSMISDGVEPTVGTFTLLLDLVPRFGEVKVWHELLNHKIKPDIEFFNLYIKRVGVSRGIEFAKKVLTLMQSYYLEPDIVTFGVLALGCRSLKNGKQLLEDMDRMRIPPNFEIMTSLLAAACRSTDFFYVLFVLEKMKKLEIKPSPKMIEMVEMLKEEYQEKLARFDRDNCDLGLNEFQKSDYFRKGFATFKPKYENWLSEVKVDNQLPWDQFKVEKFSKGKSEMVRFEKFMRMKIEERKNRENEEQTE